MRQVSPIWIAGRIDGGNFDPIIRIHLRVRRWRCNIDRLLPCGDGRGNKQR